MKSRCTTARRHVAPSARTTTILALLAVVPSCRRAAAQGGEWQVTSARPTVGDTIWLERAIGVPAGWQVRPGKLEATEELEPLGEPSVVKTTSGWVVRYPVVAWTPGAHRLELPPVWRLGPDGRTDSTAGGVASVSVTSVLPDTLPPPDPKGPLAPLRSERRSPLPPLIAGVIATALLAVGVRWRRRPPRDVPVRPHVPVEPEVPDARWLTAGEPKAVAARAAWLLRRALAQAVPAAHPALSTAECLATLERARSDAPLRELRDLLEQLDRVAFASAHGTDVAGLAAMARRLARELGGAGAGGAGAP